VCSNGATRKDGRRLPQFRFVFPRVRSFAAGAARRWRSRGAELRLTTGEPEGRFRALRDHVRGVIARHRSNDRSSASPASARAQSSRGRALHRSARDRRSTTSASGEAVVFFPFCRRGPGLSPRPPIPGSIACRIAQRKTGEIANRSRPSDRDRRRAAACEMDKAPTAGWAGHPCTLLELATLMPKDGSRAGDIVRRRMRARRCRIVEIPRGP